jgi:hypothetical protein
MHQDPKTPRDLIPQSWRHVALLAEPLQEFVEAPVEGSDGIRELQEHLDGVALACALAPTSMACVNNIGLLELGEVTKDCISRTLDARQHAETKISRDIPLPNGRSEVLPWGAGVDRQDNIFICRWLTKEFCKRR